MKYKILAKLIEDNNCIGYRVVGEDGKLKHFGNKDILKLAKDSLIVNAQLRGNYIMGKGIDLNTIESIQVTVKDNNNTKKENKNSQVTRTSTSSNKVRALKRILDLDLNPIGYLVGNENVQKFISDKEIDKYTNIVYEGKIEEQILCKEIFDSTIGRLDTIVSNHVSRDIDGKIYYEPRVLRGGRREIDYAYIEIDLMKKQCEYIIYRKLIRLNNAKDISYFGQGYMKNVRSSLFQFDVMDENGILLETIYLDIAKNKQILR